MMRAARQFSLVVVLAGCLTLRPSLPMGQMWGYEMHSSTISNLRIALYAITRPTCEVQRAKDVADLPKLPWAGFTVPQECRPVIVGPGSDYWAYSFSDGAQAATGQDWCLKLRNAHAQAYQLGECQPISLKFAP